MEFAQSLSGHDKGQYYLVVTEAEEFLFLVNGTTRPLEKAKKKNKKHVQLIKKLPEEIMPMAEEGLSNLRIKKIMKDYEKLINQSEEER